MALLGIGIGAALVPLTTAGIAGVAADDAGAASGLVNVAQQLGGSLGLGILITVFAAASGSRAAQPDRDVRSGRRLSGIWPTMWPRRYGARPSFWPWPSSSSSPPCGPGQRNRSTNGRSPQMPTNSSTSPSTEGYPSHPTFLKLLIQSADS